MLVALEGTVRRVLKTQEEQQARLEKITEHMAQSMDLQQRSIGVLARLGRKVTQLLPISASKEKEGALQELVASESVTPIDVALSRLTPTELKVLQLLVMEGPLPSPSIRMTIGKSREHTARLMKRLYEQGYVDRETSRIPYRYKVNDKIHGVLEKREKEHIKQKVERQAQEKGAA